MIPTFKKNIKSTFSFALILLLSGFLLISCETKKEKVPVTHLNRSGTGLRDFLLTADKFMLSSEYDSALRYYELASPLLVKNKRWDVYFQTLLKVIDIHRLKGHADSADFFILKAGNVLKKHFSSNQLYQADFLHRQGLIFLDKGNFDSAVLFFNQSISNRVAVSGQNDTALALTYNGLGTIRFFQSDYKAALEYYNKAYELASKRKFPEDADLSRYLQNIGIIYAQQGDYDRAEQALSGSMNIIEKITDSVDPELANRYLNMGRFMALINKDNESLSYYNMAVSILLKKVTPNHPDIASLYQNMGQSYVHLADYEKALIYFKKSLQIYENHYGANHPWVLALNMNIGYVYEKKGDYADALLFYEKSIPQDQENNPSQVKTYSNMASLNTKLDKFDEAYQYYKKALLIATEILGESHPETILLYSRFGYFLMGYDKEDEGFILLKKAQNISIRNYGEKSREASNIMYALGNYYLLAKNNPEEALSYYQDALIAYIPSFNDKDILSNPVIDTLVPDRYLINALNGKADAFFQIGNQQKPDLAMLNLSLSTYKLATGVVDKLRSSYQNDESKLLISGDERKSFLNTVKVASRLYKITGEKAYLEEAFKYADKGKSAVLMASIQDVNAIQVGNIPKNIQDLEKEIKLSLGSYDRYIYEERLKEKPDNGKINFWESKIFELEARYDSLTSILEKDYPDYYALKFEEPSITIGEIQKKLEPGRALIEYAVSDSVLYIFVINSKRAEVVVHPINKSFFDNIHALIASTSSNDLMSIRKEDYLSYTKSAFSLYNHLLKPLKGIVDDKKLIIIPDGEIGFISFDMLLNEAPDTTSMDFRKLQYLIYDYVISYSTSALLQFSDLQKHIKKPTRNLLAFAPDYNNLTDLKKDGFTDETGNTVYLLPIPGVEQEIKGIKQTTHGRAIGGDAATESQFKKEASKYNILHFAMHTLINNEEPMLSKLVFYQNGDSTEDGMLNTYELFGMELNAGLAVLSACNTGSGRLLKGEGIMNLARGFMYAGVPGIVMTMWSVEDQTSALIVKNFYTYLAKGMPKDEALRQAKLDVLADGDMLHAHPYYWAAYVTIGDYSPIAFIRPTWLNILFGVTGAGAFILLLFMLIGKRRLADEAPV